MRVLMETKSEEAEWVRAKHELLNLIEKKSGYQPCAMVSCTKKRMMLAHNKKVQPKQLKEGESIRSQKEVGTKLARLVCGE